MIQRKLPAVEGEQEAMPHILVRARTLATAALVLLSALAFVPMCSTTARAQQVVLLVDGQPITALDIEQRTKFIEMSARRTPPRQEVIDGLINELLEIREAKRYTIDPAQSDVDDAFNNIATHMNVDGAKLTQILAAGGASAGTLKQKLRAEMSWSSLVRGRFKASLEIADSDVETQMRLHDSDSPSQVGYEYILRPVLLVVPRGSPDSALDARKKEAEALRARFSDCASGVPFARALREVAVRDPVSKSSADFSEEKRRSTARFAARETLPDTSGKPAAAGHPAAAHQGKPGNVGDAPACRSCSVPAFLVRCKSVPLIAFFAGAGLAQTRGQLMAKQSAPAPQTPWRSLSVADWRT